VRGEGTPRIAVRGHIPRTVFEGFLLPSFNPGFDPKMSTKQQGRQSVVGGMGRQSIIPGIVMQDSPLNQRRLSADAILYVQNERSTGNPLHRASAIPEVEHPEEQIHLDIWNALKGNLALQEKIAKKALEAVAPKGFDAKVWELLSLEDKKAIKKKLPKQKIKTIFGFELGTSNVLLFFGDMEGDNFNFDAGINSMSLICALILTIPFGLLGTLDQDHWTKVMSQLAKCPGGKLRTYGFDDWFMETMNNIACVIYSAMSGLVLSTVYYLFKPKNEAKVSHIDSIKHRVLIFLLFMSTVTCVVGLINTTTDILVLFPVAEDDFCDAPLSKVFIVGIAFVVTAFALGLFLMW
jgi:hypothetical protein